MSVALAGVAQWTVRRPANQRSPISFPVRAHAWVGSQAPSRWALERKPHIGVSLPLILPPFLQK